MQQFDVYRNPSKRSAQVYPYLVDIQSIYISDINTRIVVPLAVNDSGPDKAAKKLMPKITFNKEQLILAMPQIFSISTNVLGKPVGSLAHFRASIIDALDFAVSGI